MAILAFPPFSWSIMAYLFPIPLVHALMTVKNWKAALRIGFVFGLLFQLGFNLWVLELHPWASYPGAIVLWLSLSLYTALFFMLFSGLFYYLRESAYMPLGFAFTWVLAEYCRSLGAFGNPGGIIGYSQTGSIVIFQLAAYFGVLGLSFFTVYIGVKFYDVFYRKRYLRSKEFVVLGLCFLSLLVLSYSRLYFEDLSLPATKVALIQGNHPQKKKLDRSHWDQIQESYLEMISGSDAPFVFTPETVVPKIFSEKAPFVKDLRRLSEEKGQRIFMGAPFRDGKKVMNSVVCIAPGAFSRYDKERLMPFGEYVPFRSVLSQIPSVYSLINFNEFSPGLETALIRSQDLNFGIGICLESVYARFFRDKVRLGADILVLSANNAWFGASSAAEKHFQMSRFRAVENNRYLIHVSNTGVSGVVSPKGRIQIKSDLDVKTVLSTVVHYGYGPSPYYRYRLLLASLFCGLGIFLLRTYFKRALV